MLKVTVECGCTSFNISFEHLYALKLFHNSKFKCENCLRLLKIIDDFDKEETIIELKKQLHNISKIELKELISDIQNEIKSRAFGRDG